MRSDASVMHRSRGQFALCGAQGGAGGRWKNERDAGIPWHGARCPSSSNYRAFISWKTSPLSVSLSLSFVHCHRWPFLPSVWCNQKKSRIDPQRNSARLDREKRKEDASDALIHIRGEGKGRLTVKCESFLLTCFNSQRFWCREVIVASFIHSIICRNCYDRKEDV